MIKRILTLGDLIEQDITTAPSLDLPNIEPERYFVPRNGGKYMLFFAKIKKSTRPEECPFCKEKNCLIFSGGSKERVIHDVIRSNYRIDIVLKPSRLKCNRCGQRFVAQVPEIDDVHPMTNRLLDYLRDECFLQSHTMLAERSGVSVESIRNILNEEVEKFDDERKNNPLLAPRVLGIDEKHINRIMRGTIVDVENGLLLDMLEDNKEQTMKKAIMLLRDWDRRIEVVTTDMNNSYLKWLPTFLPNATVVIDKFHVIQDIEQRITTTKKELYKHRLEVIRKIEDAEERIRQMNILHFLKDDGRLLNYSMETLVREDKADKALKLATVTNEFPEFRLLRELYFAVENMYYQETYEDAERAWDEWMRLLPPGDEKGYKIWCDLYSVIPPMFDCFRSFSRPGFQQFKPYILNYFKPGCRKTNAATEGLNTLIRNVNSLGNGYSFRNLRAKCLYVSLVHERINYGIDLDTVIREYKEYINS